MCLLNLYNSVNAKRHTLERNNHFNVCTVPIINSSHISNDRNIENSIFSRVFFSQLFGNIIETRMLEKSID